MGRFIKLRKNKKFSYSPRYYDDKEEGAPLELEQRFEKYRSARNTPTGLKAKWKSEMSDVGGEGDRSVRLRLLIIILILVFIFLYIIDFDLSIFTLG